MILHGFTTESSLDIADKLMAEKYPEHIIEDMRELSGNRDEVWYSLPGFPLCWKCTVKHVGQAAGFAAEVDNYPERIACVVGELGHAYRECPEKSQARDIRKAYQYILDTGCIPDLTSLLQDVVSGWRRSLQSSK